MPLDWVGDMQISALELVNCKTHSYFISLLSVMNLPLSCKVLLTKAQGNCPSEISLPSPTVGFHTIGVNSPEK